MSGTIGIKKKLLDLAKKDAANTAKIYGGTQSYANVKTPILTTTPSVPESYVAATTPTTDAIIAAYASGVPATTQTNNITASNVVNVPTTATGGETKTGGEVKPSNPSFVLGDSPEAEKIEAAYGNTVTAIDNNLARTEADIEKQRQEAIRNAYSGYDKSLSTYGQKAEQLAAMGLGNSGYSDYLTGVAYGNMVGGVQGANEGADEAIRNAYADADQLKLNAEAKKNADIAAAQENHRNNMISLLTNVGNVDSSVAEAIARSYGFSDDEVNYIKSVYGEHEKTEATNQLDFYAKHGYLVDANGNEYVPTESEIEKLGVKAAYGEEQIGEVKSGAATQNYETLKSQITAYTTDEEIDAATKDETTRAKLKADRDTMKTEQIVADEVAKIEAEAQSGTVTLGNIANVDEMYVNKEIGEETYQKIYFEKAASFAKGIETLSDYEEAVKQIDGYVNQGKISSADAENLKNYYAQSYATVIPSNTYKFSAAGNGNGDPNYYFNIDGKSFTTSEATNDTSPNKEIRGIIDTAIGDGTSAGFVVIDGKVYIRRPVDTINGKTKNIYRKVRGDAKSMLLELAKTSKNTPTKPTQTK